MEAIGLFILILIGFVCLGVLGWIGKLFEFIFDLLGEGLDGCLGCLIRLFIIGFIGVGVIGLLCGL